MCLSRGCANARPADPWPSCSGSRRTRAYRTRGEPAVPGGPAGPQGGTGRRAPPAETTNTVRAALPGAAALIARGRHGPRQRRCVPSPAQPGSFFRRGGAKREAPRPLGEAIKRISLRYPMHCGHGGHRQQVDGWQAWRAPRPGFDPDRLRANPSPRGWGGVESSSPTRSPFSRHYSSHH